MEQAITQVEGENGQEFTFITAPVTISENGEILQHTLVQQQVGADQENIDPQTQVLMLQPITVTEQQPDGQTVQHTQYILQDPSGEQSEFQTIGGNQIEFQQIIQQPVTSAADSDSQFARLQLAPQADENGQVTVQFLQQSELQPVLDVQPLQEQQQQLLANDVELQQQVQQLQQLELQPKGLPGATATIAKPKPAQVRPPVGKGPFKCEICSRIFPKWNQLHRHKKQHEEDKPHRCPECPQTFNVESNLKLHIATHCVQGSPICPECGKKFSRVASLKAHIMLHEQEENLLCPECGDEFSVQIQLDRHLEEHRQEEAGTRVYPCKQCTTEFTKLSLLREHMKQHYRVKTSLLHRTYKRNIDRTGFSYKCAHCEKSFQKPSQLGRHERIHTGERPFVCNICNRAFNQKGALQMHMAKHTGEKPHPCQFCPQMFAQKGNLRAHIQRVHSHPKDSDAALFSCAECTCVFKKLGSLNAHISRVHADQSDDMVPIQLLAPSQASERTEEAGESSADKDHEKEQQSNGSTTIVQEGKNMTEVIQHLLELSEQVTQPNGATQQNVDQNQTEKAAEDSDILQQALADSGVVQNKQGKAVGDSAADSNKGQGAGDVTTASLQAGTSVSEVELVEIAADGDGGEEDDTEVIQAVAMAAANVDHSDGKKKTGYITTMSVHDSATGTFKKHRIRKINGVRWHQCTYCTKEFKKPSDLVRHIRIHTHEKPYKCTQCFRAFAVKSTLTAHVKTHQGLKEYRCDTCMRHFSTQGSLKVHMRLHTGAKPFQCPHCEKKFRTSGHCKSHIQSHFKDSSGIKRQRRISKRGNKVTLDLPDIPLQEPILITDTGLIQQPSKNPMVQYLGEGSSIDRPFKCGYCTRGFKKSSHLKQHIRSHTGEKPYKCIQCMKAFVSSGVLKAHIRTHTGVKSYKCAICESCFTTSGSLKRHMSTHSEVRPFMCPYCQRTFKTSVNCKKHMKTHKHDLALQALQQSTDGQEVAEPEITIGQEVQDDDDDDEDNIGVQEVTEQVEVTQSNDLTQTLTHAQVQLEQEQQVAPLAIQPHDLMQQGLTQADLTQQTVIQDTLVTDMHLQNAVNPQQVFGTQGSIGQQQSLLNTRQATLNELNQLAIQQQPGDGNLDVSGMTVVSGALGASLPQILTIQSGPDGGETEYQVQLAEPRTDQDAQQRVNDRRIYVCNYCEKSFKKSSHLKQHIRTHTGERPYHCDQCGKGFVSGGVLRQHLLTHTGARNFKCDQCNTLFTTNGSLTRHLASHATSSHIKCQQCSEVFHSTFTYRRHLKKHEAANEEASRKKSSIITLSEEQAQELSNTKPDDHMSLSEKILIQSAQEKAREEKEEQTPATATAAAAAEIEEDAAEPDAETTEQQTQAEAEAQAQQEAEQEQQAAVDRKKDPDYGSTRRSKGARGHKHPNKCQHCPKSFKKPSDLVRHARIHTGEKPFVCKVCERSFRVKSTLESHLKTHEQTAAKEFMCHICNAMFSTKGSLKVHMRLHTGAKPFRCPHCDLRFRTSGHRKSHIEQHFKPAAPKKRRISTRTPVTQGEHVIATAAANAGLNILSDGTISNQQVINLDQSSLQGQGMMPITITDGLGNATGVVDPGQQGLQVMQGLDGVQLHVTGGMGQGIQITGLDPNMMTQTLQIDANLLQLLQQQGNVNLTINPNVINQMSSVDQNLISIQQPAVQDSAINPNIIIQQMPAGQTVIAAGNEAQQIPVSMEMQGVPVVGTTLQEQQSQATADELVHVQKTEGGDGEEEAIEDPEVTVLDENGDGADMDDDEVAELTSDQEDGVDQEGRSEMIMVQLPGGSLQLTKTGDDQERKFFCATCGKSFKRGGHLKEHMATHMRHNPTRSTRGGRHRCSECEKSFAKPSQLERHLRIHTGERPYVCEVCKKAFNQKNALQVHLRKHSGAKPHACPYCEAAFTQRGNLKTHIKRAHHVAMMEELKVQAKNLNVLGKESVHGGGGETSVATSTIVPVSVSVPAGFIGDVQLQTDVTAAAVAAEGAAGDNLIETLEMEVENAVLEKAF